MKLFEWDEHKNAWLKLHRQICFEDVLFCLENGFVLDDMVHPNHSKYPDQRLMIIDIEGYAFLVPYAENEKSIFFKTVIPSRKATKQYMSEKI